MQKGAPANKLIMGMPMYGQTFTLGAEEDSPQTLSIGNEDTGLNAPASTGGEAGEYTRAKGFLSYYEVLNHAYRNHISTIQKTIKNLLTFCFFF